MAKVARVGVVIMSIAMVVPAVVAELSRGSGGNDYAPAPVSVPSAAPENVMPAEQAMEGAAPEQAPKSASKVLEVPSILVGGREFSLFATQRRTAAPVHAQRQVAARMAWSADQAQMRRQLVYQQPVMDARTVGSAQRQQAAASPLYIVQQPPEHRGWKRLVTRMFGGIHDKWASWRSRSGN